MILIFTDRSDKTTIRVQKWLKSYNANYKVIYPDNEFKIIKLEFINNKLEFLFSVDDVNYDFNQISCKWFRRGDLPIKYESIDIPESIYTKNEYIVLKTFIINLFNSLPGINDIGYGNINKLHSLNIAQKTGLKIPHTLVADNINEFKNSFGNKKLIVKGIYGESFRHKNFKYWHGTKELVLSDINTSFDYTLSQEMCEKQFEIRTFYLKGEMYSMAIFSQSNDISRVDWRAGNDLEKKNRQIPYKLPKKLENNIIEFMNTVNLNCGSLDFMKDINDEYIFLEVNPVGQYDWVSYLCNYNLHGKIAETLYNYDNK